MKVIAISDLHGWLPNITERFDLLLICGDICPAHDHYYAFQEEWFRVDFTAWVNRLPFNDEHSKVVMTWGNHDFVGERYKKKDEENIEKLTNERLVILKNKNYNFKYWAEGREYDFTIFGTPYCKIFGNWAFMVDNEKLEKKYNECLNDGVDIFISHDSPYINGLGMINEGLYKGTNAGNKVLADIIEHKRFCKYFFSGHIHSGNHKFEKVGNTYMANVSFINERYYPTNPFLCFEIDNETKEVNEIKYIETTAEES